MDVDIDLRRKLTIWRYSVSHSELVLEQIQTDRT
jgi:hypothetical protein